MKKLLFALIISVLFFVDKAPAQIYDSGGIVDYVNCVFSKGSNFFSNPLQENVSNTLNNLFPTVPEGTSVSLWNPATMAFDTNAFFFGGAWTTDFLLAPGTGALVVTPSAFTNTLAGLIVDNDGFIVTNLNQLTNLPSFSEPPGVYLLGEKLPIVEVGTNIFINIIGRMPNAGEQVMQLSGTSTYLGNGVWDTVPTLAIGQAAFLNIGPVVVPVPPNAPGWVNLDFEMARIPGNPGSFSPVNPADAFPGWTVNAGYVSYDSVSLSGGSASIIDTNSNGIGLNFPTIQGKYFALLEGLNGPPFFGGTGPTSIGQTGLVPSTAKTITFWGQDDNLQISFAGNLLTFVPLSTTPNYVVYGADISAFAGQTGELLFDAPGGAYGVGGGGEIDNIQFSVLPLAVPGLTINQTTNGSIISWPLTVAAWRLQTNKSLAPGTWGNYTGQVTNNTVTNPPASGSLFFRLVYP